MAIAPPRGFAGVSATGPRSERAALRRRVLGGTVRVLGVTGALVAVYVTAPLDRHPSGAGAVRLCLSLLLLGGVLGLQVRSVSRSPFPTLRGVEVVAVSVPMLVLSFAAVYFATGSADPGAFSEDLSRLDAAYFSVTVLATVGFGDITPVTEAARSMLIAQMLLDLVLGGFIAKVLVGAVHRRREALADARGGSVPPPASAAPPAG
jgi:hypothetical protein